MAHIFISYSKQDAEFARHLRHLLENEGFGVWMDETALVPSERWWPEIEENIETCAAFIVIMSPNSRTSDWVEREILYAERLDRPIFPVLFRGESWPRLANIQYQDMSRGLRADLPSRLVAGLHASRVPVAHPDVPPQLPGETITGGQSALPPRSNRRAVWAILAVIALIVVAAVVIGLIALSGGDGSETDTPTPTMIPAGSSNTEWEPVVREFNGIPFVKVPAGCFMMGSDDGYDNEQDVHEVCLSEYWIMQTEVTNAQYKQCVTEEACEEPQNLTYYNDPEFADHPVVYISWDQALKFAQWIGGSLPTEAQWEYAAAGTESWVYPWGSDEPTCAIAQYVDCEDNTVAVGPDQRPNGASWVGAHDTGGNVWEWAYDGYTNRYEVSETPPLDPIGPESGKVRVIRGGAFDGSNDQMRTAYRGSLDQDTRERNKGFRCVRLDMTQ